MVGPNTLIKLVQTDNNNISKCNTFGNETLIINVDGGVYLGNNTTSPLLIADINDLVITSLTRSQYDLITKNDNTLYYIFDTNEVYKGTVQLQGRLVGENPIIVGTTTLYFIAENDYNIIYSAIAPSNMSIGSQTIYVYNKNSQTWEQSNVQLMYSLQVLALNLTDYGYNYFNIARNNGGTKEMLIDDIPYTTLKIGVQLDNVPTSGSTKLLTSGAIYEALQNSQDSDVFVVTATSASTNTTRNIDKTIVEINSAYTSGKDVLLIDTVTSNVYSLSASDAYHANFSSIETNYIHIFNINTDYLGTLIEIPIGNAISSNTTNTITSGGTGLPTAGTVYNALQNKADSATTLNGYGITDAKIENGTITLGNNTITPLTAYTESDPIFTASVAYNITQTDITKWNNKADSATTLNGYGITDAKIENGTITLGNNTITPLTAHQTLSDLGITATAAELNVMDGITASTTELNYTDGVTSNIQVQFDNITELIPTEATTNNQLADKDYVADLIRLNSTDYIASNSTMTTGFESLTAYGPTPQLEVGPWYKMTPNGISACNSTTGVYVTKDDYSIVINDESLLYFTAHGFKYQRFKDGGDIYTDYMFGGATLPDGTSAEVSYNPIAGGFMFTDNSHVFSNQNIDFVVDSLTVTTGACKEFVGGWSQGATPTATYDIILPTSRYICTGDQTASTAPTWTFQYIISDISLTSTQLTALNSGIDSSKVTQITTNENNIAAINNSTVMNSGISASKVGNYDTHIADTTIHVTTADKNAWNAKQDTISGNTSNYGTITVSSNTVTLSSSPIIYGTGSSSAIINVTSGNTASGVSTFVGGNENSASNENGVIFGYGNTSMPRSDVENYVTPGNALATFITGRQNIVTGDDSVAHGFNNVVSNDKSMAVGQGLIAGNSAGESNSNAQVVFGQFNESGNFKRITGNGTDNNNRSNCETLDSNGVLWTANDVVCGGNNQSGATHQLSKKITEPLVEGTNNNVLTTNGNGVRVWKPVHKALSEQVIPVVYYNGEVETIGDLPSMPSIANIVTTNESNLIMTLFFNYVDDSHINKIVMSVAPGSGTDDVWFRNSENWSRNNNTNLSIDGVTLADVGFTVTLYNSNYEIVTNYTKGTVIAEINLINNMTVTNNSVLSMICTTWGATYNDTDYNNEYTLTTYYYNFTNIRPLTKGTAYKVISEDAYYVYNGIDWSAHDIVADQKMVDILGTKIGGSTLISEKNIKSSLEYLLNIPHTVFIGTNAMAGATQSFDSYELGTITQTTTTNGTGFTHTITWTIPSNVKIIFTDASSNLVSNVTYVADNLNVIITTGNMQGSSVSYEILKF